MSDAAILAAFDRFVDAQRDGENVVEILRAPVAGPRTWLAEVAIDGIAYVAYWAHLATPPRWQAI